MVCPQAGQAHDPWISRRRPSRLAVESRRANRSTRIAAPEELSRLLSGTRTGVLQTGHRAGFRQVQPITGFLRTATELKHSLTLLSTSTARDSAPAAGLMPSRRSGT